MEKFFIGTIKRTFVNYPFIYFSPQNNISMYMDSGIVYQVLDIPVVFGGQYYSIVKRKTSRTVLVFSNPFSCNKTLSVRNLPT